MTSPAQPAIVSSVPASHADARAGGPAASGYAVFADQINLLYQQTANSLGLAMVAALVLVAMLWNAASHLALMLWFGALLVISGARLATVHYYEQRNAKRSPKFWRNLYLLGAFLNGFVWGWQVWMIDLDWAPQYQFSVLLILTAVAAGGAWVNSAYFYAALSFLLPLITPVLILLLGSGAYYHGMAILVIVFAALLLEHAHSHQRELIDNLRLRHENEQLVHTLTLSNAQLREQQSILERDSLLAQRVFRKLTQQGGQPVPGITYWEHAAGNFSGDLLLVAERPDGGFMMFLGDFTGHGLPSALGAVPASTIFYSMSRKGLDLIDIAAELNFRLRDYLPAEYFCCAVLVQGDFNAGRLRVWNAGMPPVLQLGRDGALKAKIASRQLPLGIMPYQSNELRYEELRLQPGDSVYLFTDGLIEAENRQGQIFGETHFETVLKAPRFGETRVDAVKESILQFLDGLPAQDDISLVEVSVPLRHQRNGETTEPTELGNHQNPSRKH